MRYYIYFLCKLTFNSVYISYMHVFMCFLQALNQAMGSEFWFSIWHHVCFFCTLTGNLCGMNWLHVSNYCFLQTQTKILKMSQPSRSEPVTQDEVISAALEPPPYGTSHVVGTISC